jgi:alkylation response protein AidB-like acyl-CoA dehydrogenase
MSFKLTEEQLMIQSMVRDLAREEFAPRAMELDRTKTFPRDNLNKLAELGLMGMMGPSGVRRLRRRRRQLCAGAR